MREKRNACRLLVGKPEGKRPLGRPRRVCADSIKMNLIEVGWYEMDWIDLPQDGDQWRALVNTLMNSQVLYNAGKFLSSSIISGFSRNI
jgi:hypothetical protein